MTRNILRFLVAAVVVAALTVSHGTDLQGLTTTGPFTVAGIDKPVLVHRGAVTSNTTWSNDAYHVLRGVVSVESGATLTVQAGTTVVGELATIGTLLVRRGGRIEAVGTAAAPITFTSDQPVGARARGDWGGLIINGFAQVNLPGGEGIGEGDTGVYGGTNDADNSGTLKYVRVEYAGIEFSPDNELNGIAFQAVGSGTTVDYVQVKHNKDDCVEFFGGAVDARHLVLNYCGDDSLDWTFGWRGRAQFVVVQQSGDDADNGLEGDNNGNNFDLLPRSKPLMYNFTILGDPDSDEGSESDDGLEWRVGTAGHLKNFVLMGFKENGVDLSDNATVAQYDNGEMQITNGIVFGNGTNYDSTSRSRLTANALLWIENPGLVDPFNLDTPNWRPSSVATPAGGQRPPATPPNDGFFEATTYLGAVPPAPGVDWTAGWINTDRN
jgi:hypothetical protein